MSDDSQYMGVDAATAPAARTALANSRRRLLRGGLAATPLLMTIASRPVMAGTCAPASSFASINASRHGEQPPVSCDGVSPGYWKEPQHFREWPEYWVPSAKAIPGKGWNPPLNAQATLFNTVFGAGFPELTLLQVLDLKGGDKNSVGRYIVAALLNAATNKTAGVMDVDTVKTIWTAFNTHGYYEPTAGIKWYADHSVPASDGGLKYWIESTWHGGI
ncbi:MAG: hypothetical protein V4792_18110 [Pseudomonadota bacterium]